MEGRVTPPLEVDGGRNRTLGVGRCHCGGVRWRDGLKIVCIGETAYDMVCVGETAYEMVCVGKTAL